MECSRKAAFVVDTAEPASYWSCERHVRQVAAHRRGIRVEESSAQAFCTWEMLTVGDMIRIILGDREWTQKKLSKISGVPQQSISELIRGKKRLLLMTAVKLAAALELCPLAMLGTQIDYALWQWEQDNPGVADEVRARVEQLSQESE